MNTNSSTLYIDRPCERCGSKKHVSKMWVENLKTSNGTSRMEITQITCTNKECQAEFDKNRAKEIQNVKNRKLAKEEQDKNRKESIARTVAERKRLNELLVKDAA